MKLKHLKILFIIILITLKVFSNNYQSLLSSSEILFQQKKHSQALTQAFRALELAEKQYGKRSKQTKDILYFISLIYYYSNQKDKAKEIYLRYANIK